jgi:hypothetical protein
VSGQLNALTALPPRKIARYPFDRRLREPLLILCINYIFKCFLVTKFCTALTWTVVLLPVCLCTPKPFKIYSGFWLVQFSCVLIMVSLNARLQFFCYWDLGNPTTYICQDLANSRNRMCEYCWDFSNLIAPLDPARRNRMVKLFYHKIYHFNNPSAIWNTVFFFVNSWVCVYLGVEKCVKY